jgi:hypothetical protein
VNQSKTESHNGGCPIELIANQQIEETGFSKMFKLRPSACQLPTLGGMKLEHC